MGNRTLNFIGIATPTTSRTDAIKQDADIASVRVNYRWGGPVIAKY
jgi:outer membrane immunogenic protein